MSRKSNAVIDKVWAILVAARLQPSNGELDTLHPLGKDLPFALTPICNVPLIDYALESLVQNGVEQVFVLHDDRTHAISDHLSSVRSMRGKAWTENREMKVVVVESTRPLLRPHHATDEIIAKNLVPETKSVVWVPIDSLTNFTGLRDMVARHQQRFEQHTNYAATMITVSDPLPLRQAYEAASNLFGETKLLSMDANNRRPSSSENDGNMMQNGSTTPSYGGSQPNGTSFGSPNGSSIAFPDSSSGTSLQDTPDVHRMTVVHDQHGIVHQIHRHELDVDDEEDGGANDTTFKITFNKKLRLSVRSDLVFFGWVILSPGALGLIKFHTNDLFELLGSIIDNNEIEQNTFGLDVAPPNTAYCTMNALQGLLQTNLDVMARVLYPLTRESNFADQHSHYTVSHYASSVYLARLHNIDASSDLVLSHRSLGPYAVIGAGALIPSSSTVVGSTIGKHVQIGEHTVIERCIIMDDVQIGSRCVLRDTVVGPYSFIASGSKLHRCIIGRSVTLRHDERSERPVCLDNARVEHDSKREPDVDIVGSCGRGQSSGPVRLHLVPSLTSLFTSDPIPRDPAEQDEEEDEDATPWTKFLHALVDVVEMSIRTPSRIENAKIEMKNLRTSFQQTNGDLAKAVLQLLLQHAQKQHPTSAADAFNATFTMLQHWCRPFFTEFVSNQDDMIKVLEGVCLAIGTRPAESCLFGQAPRIFEALYNTCDDDLYDEREYCVVSGKSLLAFDDWVQELEAEPEEHLDEEEKAVLAVGKLCIQFIEGVDKFLNEQ